jgi:hypothetical protein
MTITNMTINEHVSEFAGLPVAEYDPTEGLPSPADHAIRLGLTWESIDEGKTFVDLFATFLADPQSADVQALLIGDWGAAGQGTDSSAAVEPLVSARHQLPKLRALFLGEMVVEESEISWITQSDVSSLFEAFPQLEVLYIRGGNDLRLGRPRHANLRKLVIETGGMDGSLVREVTAAQLPRLEHLELWLGDDGYGRGVVDSDLRELFASGPCRQLKYLGLRDDCEADQTAALLATIGLPPSVQVLDLSLGTLGDEGAAALAAASWLPQLEKLDIHFHYVSPEMVSRLESIVADVDSEDRQQPDDWDGEEHRYVAVGE